MSTSRTSIVLALLCAAGVASGQEPEPAEVERLYVPENGFDRVLKKHPRGVIVSEAELRELLAKAGVRPATEKPAPPPPVAATIERLRITGEVTGELAVLRAEAEVAVLAPGVVALPIPLEGIGLRKVRLNGTDRAARVFRTRRGTAVLLLGPDQAGEPVARTLAWEFAVRVTPGDERGSGTLRFPVPGVASGSLELYVAGDVELANAADLIGGRKKQVVDTGGAVLWSKGVQGETTRIAGAFGGRERSELSVSFRPRRSTLQVTPYTTADTRGVFHVRQGVVSLHAAAKLEIYRAGRERFQLALPEGFVVRALTVSPGELTYVQKGSRVDVRLDTARKGRLVLRLEAELATGAGERQQLALRPVGFPDTDRVVGASGVLSGVGSVVTFGEVEGLERADLSELGLASVLNEGSLLRVYRRDRANRAALAVTVEPVQPRVGLTIKAALALSEREVKAVTLYTYEVLAGRVYVVRARLPKGYTFEGATVADDQRRRLEHQLKETQVEGQTEIAIELDKGLEAGQGLLLTVQATDQRPGGVAGRTLDVPVFSGSPADQTQGHLGFAPDASFTLAGSKLSKLVPIPAEELPRVGVDVAGLVLGYRLEGADYGGRIAVKKKQTQVMAEILARHRVHERVIETDVRLNLDVDGAPIKTLDVQLPKGTGLLAKIEGEDLRDDRERVGETEDGQERWRLRFDRPKQGSFALNVRYAQKLEASEGQSELTAAVGRVSLGPAAFRERGTLAIYSSDSTELVPEPAGLRAIEVTEVPGALAVANERPLFAYTHVGAEHGLKLAIKRHGTQDVLTAVAEALVLETTAGPDGVSRHTATFSVKNLNNQFFALKLPKDAVLWSVVVDGEGVKPAKEGELELIPIPTAGAKGANQITTVEAVYTVASPAWGVTGRAGLEAPVLQRSGDAVPVLHTTWKLSLPDDYRVLEWAGNVNGPPAVVASPLLGRLGAMAGAAGWPLWLGLFALVGLGFGVSSTLRRAGLRTILAAGDAGAGASRVARSPGLRRVAKFGAVVLVGVFAVGLCLTTLVTSRGGVPGLALDNSFSKGTNRIESELEDGMVGGAEAPGGDFRYDTTDDAGAMDGGDWGGEGSAEPMPDPAAEPAPAQSPMAPPPPARKPKSTRPDGAKDMASLGRDMRRAKKLDELRSQLGSLRERQRESERKNKGRYKEEAKKELAKAMPGDDDDMDAPDDVVMEEEMEEAEEPMPDAESDGMTQIDPPSLQLDAGPPLTPIERLRMKERRVDELFAEIETLAEERQVEELVGKFSELRQLMNEVDRDGDELVARKLRKWNDRLQSFGEVQLSVELQLYVNEGNQHLRRMAEARKAGDAAALQQELEQVREVVTRMNEEGRDVYRQNAGALWARASALAKGAMDDEKNIELTPLTGGLAGKAEEKPVKRLPVRHSQLGSFGQVGLRSLVMELPAVGHQHAFTRPGGEAVLEVRFVREASLVSAAGLLALVAFLAGVFLPRTGKLASTGLIAVGLGVVTAIPVALAGAWFTPLLNALALGLVVAAPVSLLFALGAAWKTAPRARLQTALRELRAEREATAAPAAQGAGPGNGTTSRIVFSLFLLAAAFLPTQAVEAQEKKKDGDRPQVFVPYDPAETVDPAGPEGPNKVYVPLDVYEELHRRAFPDAAKPKDAPPPAPYVVAETAYTGKLDGGLRLTAEVRVGVLAKGWQRCFLGLQGTGLEASKVSGTHEGARVAVAPAGGFELVAQGPGSYRVTLELVVPRRSGGYTFATVPCYAATLAVETTAKHQRLVVGGARAQQETRSGDVQRVDASLGDAKSVTLSLRSREELSSGASEASANTKTLVWVQRGRMSVVSETTFSISGAGREGFVFTVPEGFEVTDVSTPGLRSWSSEGGRVELKLRRPTGRTAVVRISGEQRIEPDTRRFLAPEIAAQGVSRESGTVGLSVEQGLRVRPVRPRLRQVDVGTVTSLARMLRAGGVESAYGFARRPAKLELELVTESVEVKADVDVRATVLADLYVVEATLNYDVTRGKLYTLEVMAPAGLELAGSPEGLDVREVRELEERRTKTSRTYRLGLASGLTGSGRLQLTFGTRLSVQEATQLAFPDVRPLGVSRETATIALSSASALRLRVPDDPAGLAPRDVRRLSLRAPRRGASWRLAYARPNGRVPGLAVGRVVVDQPRAYVTGSWVLHARVERDVVRYALRAFFEIENAGVQKFSVLVPERAGEQVTVDAQNQREVTNTAGPEGQRRYTIELQSPALGLYNLGLSWEEVLEEGQPFTLPQVGVAGVDRKVRGFLLVEKAPEVVDVLEEVSTSGSVKSGARASDAPALPPGKGARDFVFAYSVPLTSKDPWSVKCRMKKADVKLPPAARIPWARIESVFSREGEVRHRVRYRVHNLRLQFLALELPGGANVWSVFVDGAPKRLHTDGKLALVPLPKRSAADLSFDVEMIYATPPGQGFGGGESQALLGPLLRTENVKVEKTFWSVYTPAGYDCSGFAGNLDGSVAGSQDATVLEAEVKEYARLAELAQRAQGNQKEVADYNLRQQQQRINQQIVACETNLQQDAGQQSREATAGKQLKQAQELVALNNDTYNKLNFQIEDRRKRDQERAQRLLEGQQALAQDEVQVDGNTFQRAESGWATNARIYKKGNKVQWEGVGDEDTANAPPQQFFAGQQLQQQQQKTPKKSSNYSIVVKEGEELALSNTGIAQESAAQQRRRGGQYGYYQKRAQRAKQQEAQQLDTQRGGYLPQSLDPDLPQTTTPSSDSAPDTGRAASTQGLMSIRVDFQIPADARSHHFASETVEAPELSFTSHSVERTGSWRALARAGVLLVLLIAVVRLGLLGAAPGRRAAQALLLLGASIFAYLVFLHPVGAVVTFLVSLLALRNGPLAMFQNTGEA